MSKKNYHEAITLSDEAKKRLASAVKHLHYPGPQQSYDQYVFNAECSVRNALPRDLLWQLQEIKTSPAPLGTLLIRNLPIDPGLPPTPKSANYDHSQHPTTIAQNILVGISAILGFPIGHEEEKDGHLVHTVFPVQHTDKPLSNEGNVDFGLHVENAMFQHREKFIVLSCLRQDPMKQATTPVADVRQAIKKALADDSLSPSDVLQLRKSEYVIRKPYILDRSEVQGISAPLAILSGSLDNPNVRCTFYANGTRGLTPKAQRALDKFGKAVHRVVNPVKLTPGDMVIVNNHKVLHGRSKFQTFFDGTDRYLIRSYVMGDLQPVQDLQVNSTYILRRALAK